MPLPSRLKILVRMCDVSLIVRRCRLWLDDISSCLFSESTHAGSPLLHCRHATLIAVKLPFIFLLLRLPLDPQRNRACIISLTNTSPLRDLMAVCIECMVPAACHHLQLVKFPQPCHCYLLFHSNNEFHPLEKRKPWQMEVMHYPSARFSCPAH